MSAGCLIICTGVPVSLTIKKMAAEKGCRIISTPYDTYIVARLINQSTPIHYFMKTENLITFETDDFTEDVKKVMAKVRHRDFPVLDVYGSYYGMISRRSLLDVQKKGVILVDHNEKSQAVDGLETAEVLEIIDHHRIGSLETMTPVFFRNQPVGCTATIIYQMYQESRVEIEPAMAGLLCAAIVTDTLMFRSPTCTGADRDAAENLSKIAGINIAKFADELFRSGSNLKSKSPEELLYHDFKTYSVNKVSFAVGQINFMNTEDLQEAKKKLLEYLSTSFRRNDIDMLFIMLTNILEESSELLFFGEGAKETAETAMKTTSVTDSLSLKGVVSRKKQMIPALMAALQ
jgi:manganese-dependent inorganic pyrophosphatase